MILWSVSDQGPHDPHLSTLPNRLQRHLSNLREIQHSIWNLYQKKIFFPKLQKSEEILEIRKKMKFSFSEFRKNRFDNFILLCEMQMARPQSAPSAGLDQLVRPQTRARMQYLFG